MQSLMDGLSGVMTHAELERRMLQMEQCEAPVVHRFAPGICLREVTMPAGSLVVGHYHTTRHANIMLRGKGVLLIDGQLMHVEAPFFYVADPGRKVAYWTEETVWQNIFPTDLTDVEEIEGSFLRKSLEFQESVENFTAIARVEDRIDFDAFLRERNLSDWLVRKISEDAGDAVPLPDGSYKFQVGPSQIEGKGIFATADIGRGEDIAPARIAGKRTVVGRFTNHAKEPNAVMVLLDSGVGELEGQQVVVLRAIKEIKGNRGGQLGEEITVDYRQVLEVQQCQQSPPPLSSAG